MTKSKYNLPRSYISWSQYYSWNTSPRNYARRYFEGEAGFENAEMRFGKEFADCVEKGIQSENETINLTATIIPRFQKAGVRLDVKLNTIKGVVDLMGYTDTHNNNLSKFKEYKTGVMPWTQAKVDAFKQITFYATMMFLLKNKIPTDIELIWLPTEKSKHGVINFTGDMHVFKTERTMQQILEMMKAIQHTARDISTAYSDHQLKETLQ